MWCGANRFEHTEVTRQDEVIRQFWGFERMAGHKSFQRFFNKFDLGTNQKVFTPLYQWFFKNLQFNNLTLDVDSTIHTRYGTQQGAKKGYNPKKPGRLSHHPLMAFVAETKMVANFWLRSGDAYTSNNIEAFLDDTFEKLQGKKIGLFRADSGFYDKKVLHYLEDKKLNYIVAVRLYAPVQQLIASHKTWLRLSSGIEVAESVYQSPLWDKPRRIVMVRQHIPTRPKATGRSLKLFQDEGIYKQYRYSCFITSLDLPCEQIWTLYRQRADSENRIKELGTQFGLKGLCCRSFWATEAACHLAICAYNLCVGLQRRLGQPQRAELTTLRWRLFSCAAVFSHAAGKPTLKLAVATPQRRAWWHVLLRQLSADEPCDAVAALSARAGPHQLILPSIA